MSEVSAALVQQAHAMCADPRFRALVARNAGVAEWPQGGALLDCSIHPDDQMLLHSLLHHQDANAAVSQYFNVGLQQFRAFWQIRALLGIDRRQDAAVLDFACGYGRLLRFLAPLLPAGTLWASEIQADALDFVQAHFGVSCVPSAYEPDEFRPGRRFDLIWVASLFSHLPGHLFHAWLARLKDLLDEGGALCFSAHDACLLPPGQTMTADGISFHSYSENSELDTSVYGTTYVTEDYVRETVRRACGEGFGCHRIPRGLAHEQDLYVVARAGELDLDALGGFRYGPWGWVDERRIDADGSLYLRGWAASLDDGVLDDLDIRVDGRPQHAEMNLAREDVALVFDAPRLLHAGWQLRLELGGTADQAAVEVLAQDAHGVSALLYAGSLHAPPAAAAEPAPPQARRQGWLERLLHRFGL